MEEKIFYNEKGYKNCKKGCDKKIFIIDTNVMIYSPNCLETFEDNIVILPAVCFEELDKLKNSYDLKGFYAREFLRNFEKIRASQNIINGAKLENSGTLYVRYLKEDIQLPSEFNNNCPDNIILKTAIQVEKEFNQKVTIVTKDTNLRIKAEILGLYSEDYYHDKSSNCHMEIDDSFSVKDEIITEIYSVGYISAHMMKEIMPKPKRYCLLKGENDSRLGVLLKYNYLTENYERIEKLESSLGIVPINYQQKFLLDALFDNNIKIIFVIGIAGTGKTLLSISAGLMQVLNKRYKKLILSRTPVPMGRDIGYLPGDINEKLDPWFRPVYDNLEFILGKMGNKDFESFSKEYANITIDYLKSNNFIEIEGLTYIRGRTFHNSFVVIDEAQNLTPHEVKTIITRVGKNSKIILTGDIYQIDNPYVDENDNGLSYASERFLKVNSEIAETIYLTKCERSEVSMLAASIL